MQKKNKNNYQLIDFGSIIKYFVMWLIFGLIAYGIKMVVLRAFEASPTHQVGNGILTLYEVHNTGAAFNLFAGQQEIIITASVIALLILTGFAIVWSGRLSYQAVSAMSLLSAGITMNLWERLNLGYVIDYIHCEFAPNIPVFNVPDIMIFIGAVCLILSVFSKR